MPPATKQAMNQSCQDTGIKQCDQSDQQQEQERQRRQRANGESCWNESAYVEWDAFEAVVNPREPGLLRGLEVCHSHNNQGTAAPPFQSAPMLSPAHVRS